ncbi:MAG: bifunctional (p)ppGpp synthetase/guanosine-3',5'-bis(diphosphate) 3'-pyrophosphohydrolase, partial [Deltaproteobacteria bacterium]|nr:bifunctional (p)ppGpp synthetase/guanosine-3',5'-bis(diphosphate) 3'-pyrophosphohydrolase [Deltaproteobacteria bacterium]
MHELEQILSEVAGYYPAADIPLVRRAYQFAAAAHDGQTRKSGDPYVTHPLAVARIIAELKLDVASVCAGLLHDCVEDTSATVDQLGEIFGKEIAFLVDGVTKLGKLPYSTREEQQAENFRKMLLAMARDIRVILVKLCDRLDNMRSLEHLPPEKQERIAAETMQIYAPLANRLGIQWVKVELEDLAFKYTNPGEYEQLAADVAKTRAERLEYIHAVEKLIQAEMEAGGVPCEVMGRAKHLWSIYQKMRRTQRPFEDIHDSIGFRVITDTQMHCYQALGVSHQKWTPLPGRFKDYIALPKPNLYQSLHTAVIGPRGERIEIQIRTREMNLVAEHGIAAHWKYKEGKLVVDEDDKKFAWLRQLMESQKELRDPTEFLESVKIDLFGDEVYVFTPGGDVKALPKGSCPIDFAYAVHSSIGDHCSGARVNGMIVPLRYQLRNGDTIEIITSPNQKPNKDWLKLVKTARARTKIRWLLRQEQRDKAVVLGTDLIDKALRKHNTTLSRAEKQLQHAARELKTMNVDELIIQVGYGKITAQQVLEKALPELDDKDPEKKLKPESMLKTLLRKVTRRTSSSGIKVAGEEDILVRFAKCCSPLPGDPIHGFITRGRGVTVHRRDCDKGLDLDPERRIEVEWDGHGNAQHEVAIQVLCADKPGLLAHISQSFTDQGVNISQA